MKNSKEYTPKSKRQHCQDIEGIFYQIMRVTQSAHYFENFIESIRQDELHHRKLAPSNCRNFGLTVTQAVQYFACKWVLMGKTQRPDPKEYLSTKKQVFTGYAIYHTYKEAFKADKVFNKLNKQIIETFDYSEYV
jgi:hypothetical protein